MVNSNKYKTLFLSDIHLGFNGCQCERLESFLNSVEADKIFLVGDIVDLWSMKENFYWPKSHQRVIDKLNSLQSNGTEIKYISGDIKIIETLCRIDTKNELEYFKNGGILQYVLRNMI